MARASSPSVYRCCPSVVPVRTVRPYCGRNGVVTIVIAGCGVRCDPKLQPLPPRGICAPCVLCRVAPLWDRCGPMLGRSPLLPPTQHPQDLPGCHMKSSEQISDSLERALPGHGFDLVRRVAVELGWGDIYFVTVHSRLRRGDVSPSLETVIHDVVGRVLAGRRHQVTMRWASL